MDEKLHYIIAEKARKAARERANDAECARRAKLPPTWENFAPARSAAEIRLEIEWEYMRHHGKHHTKTRDCEAVERMIMRAQIEEKEREEARVFEILQAQEESGY